MGYYGKFGHNLGRIQHISLMIRIYFFMQRVFQKPQMWHTLFLVYKVSRAVFNIWLVTYINPYFILLIIIMVQISSDLHGVGINLKTTQPRIVYNTIKMGIVLEFSTEDGQFQVLFTLCLLLLSTVNYRFNQLYNLNLLMENQIHLKGCQGN